MWNRFLTTTGINQMEGDKLFLFIVVILIFSFVVAWLLDSLMGDAGFGLMLNWVCLLFWLVLGPMIYNQYYRPLKTNPAVYNVALMCASAFAGLLFTAIFIQVIRRK